MSGVSGWIEAYNPHINFLFRSSNTLDPHFAGTNLVNVSVPKFGLRLIHFSVCNETFADSYQSINLSIIDVLTIKSSKKIHLLLLSGMRHILSCIRSPITPYY